MKKLLIMLVSFGAMTLISGCGTICAPRQGDAWRDTLAERLPEYGHRNWIVVADSAYPKQSAPGIETIYTGKKQVEVLRQVLKEIDSAPHIRPIVMHDAELASVAEADAPGVSAYREELKGLIENTTVEVMPHEDIIGLLDEDSTMFNVLLLKTDMVIPYTSVFIKLDCGYWSAEKEMRLRKSLEEN